MSNHNLCHCLLSLCAKLPLHYLYKLPSAGFRSFGFFLLYVSVHCHSLFIWISISKQRMTQISCDHNRTLIILSSCGWLLWLGVLLRLCFSMDSSLFPSALMNVWCLHYCHCHVIAGCLWIVTMHDLKSTKVIDLNETCIGVKPECTARHCGFKHLQMHTCKHGIFVM